MKKITLTLILIIALCSLSFGQDNELIELKSLKNNLLEKISELKDSIKKIDKRIVIIESQKNMNLKTDFGEVITRVGTKTIAKVKNEANMSGDVIAEIPKNHMVDVYDLENDKYWKISYRDSIYGYIYQAWLYENFDMKDIREGFKLKRLVKEYGEDIGNKLSRGSIWEGMTSQMARESLGEPLKINRSTGSYGVHEQWVYKNKNLYFEDGKLTSYQN